MMVRRANFTAAVLCAAMAILLLAGRAMAQLPQPFSPMPPSTDVVARINFQALEEEPALAAWVAQEKAKNPQFLPTLFISTAGRDDKLMSEFAKKFPGELRILETGTSSALALKSPGYGCGVFYGRINADELMNILTTQGWSEFTKHQGLAIFASPALDQYLVMPNAWTIYMASDTEMMKVMLDAGAGRASGVTKTNAKIDELSRVAFNSHLLVATGVTAAMKQKLASETADMPPQVKLMFPGIDTVLAEAQNANTATVSVANLQGALKFNVAFDMATDASAQSGAAALNQLVPSVVQLAKMQSNPNDKATQQRLDQMAALRFGVSGKRVFISLPMSAETFAQFAQGMRAGAAGAMGQ